MIRRKLRPPHYQLWAHRENGEAYAVRLGRTEPFSGRLQVTGICGPLDPHELPPEREWPQLAYTTGPEARRLVERQAEFIRHVILPDAPRRMPRERA